MNNKYFEILLNKINKVSFNDDVPVAALIVKDNEIISVCTNTNRTKLNPLGHAEINCIYKSCKKLNAWRLDDCEMYVTLEPCHMCKEIIRETKIKNVYYLLKSNKKINYKTSFIQEKSELSTNYLNILTNFFKKLR